MENERNKKQETVPTPADDDDKGIDTKAFQMTEMKWFLPFTVRCLWGQQEDYKGTFLVFYPSQMWEMPL